MRRGKAWGSLSFAHNYSESLVERTEFGQNVEDYIVDSAQLDVQLDMSSKHIYIRIDRLGVELRAGVGNYELITF